MLFVRDVILYVTVSVLLIGGPAFADILPLEKLASRSPARHADPAFGISAEFRNDVDNRSYSAFGEWGGEIARVGFATEVSLLDSLYEGILSEISGSVNVWAFSFGGGYALSMEWIDDGAFWSRHRLSAGVALRANRLSIRGWTLKFMDEPFDFWGGAYWDASEDFAAFVKSDGNVFEIGSSVCFAFACVESSYAFPGFSFAVGLHLSLGLWNAVAVHGFEGGLLDRNRFMVIKKLKK